MNDWLTDTRSRDDTIRIPTIWLAAALSIILHSLVLWVWLPELEKIKLDSAAVEQRSEPLTVQIAPERAPQRAAAAPALPPLPGPQAASRSGLPPKPAARPPSPPRPVPFNRPAPYSPPAPPVAKAPAPPAAKPPAPPAVGDLAEYIEARRRERGETPAPAVTEEPAPAAPPESEEDRRKRIIASNLGLDRTPSFGGDPRRGGGIFQIERMSSEEAEFVFFGWNKDIRRNSKQRIQVRRGDNPDIQIALVRRMIVIIREHERGDFTWVSHRLGREITLSARPADTAGLEDVLMREFFSVTR